MRSNIVDEYTLYELILKYEFLLHWIWISIFTEFTNRRCSLMKVPDELKMRLLHYTPVHCLSTGLSTPVEINFVFSHAIMEWGEFLLQTDILLKESCLRFSRKKEIITTFTFCSLKYSWVFGKWASFLIHIAACLLLIWNLVVSWASPGKSRSMSDVLKLWCLIKAGDWMWLSLIIVKGLFRMNIWF